MPPIPAMVASPVFLRFLCLYLLLLRVSAAGATAFDFRTLNLSDLKLLGDAHLDNHTVRLTQDLATPNSGAGRALYPHPISFRPNASFSTFFTFAVRNLNPSSIGGGLAFLIAPDDISVGDAGGSLGLSGNGTGFVAVEFDTLMDVQFDDINGNHVGLDINSLVSMEVGDLEAQEVDLKSGDLINVWIDYDGSRLRFNVSVSYSNIKPYSSILSLSDLNLSQYLNDWMFVGFSGSTQGSTEIHSVEWWSFSSSLDSSSGPQAPSAPPEAANSTTATATIARRPTLAPARSETKKTSSPSKIRRTATVAGAATAAAFFLAIISVVLFYLFSERYRRLKKPAGSLVSEFIGTPKVFSYRDLKSATKCFNPNRIIGHGAFGTVYKGILPETGDVVAVKRCSHSTHGKTEFLSELSIIGSLRHRNLVRLQGWCQEKNEILLVYDLMPNGSLDKALFEARAPLPWHHRRKILMGVASALAYLHQECENRVIHRDIKSSNIMLDEGFNARLGDFGLARQIEHDKSPDGAAAAAGTMGYLAPEYLLTGRANEQTDVFSYGAVVLEVASGRRPIERDRKNVAVGRLGLNSSLVEWVWGLHREGRLLMAADEAMRGEFDEAEMRRVLLVGLACSHPDPLARPSMRGVAQMLMGEAEVPVVPRAKPSLTFSTSHLLSSLQDSVSDCNGMIALSSSSSDQSFAGELV